MLLKKDLPVLKHLLKELINSEGAGIIFNSLPIELKKDRSDNEIELIFRKFANIFLKYNAGEYFDNGFGWVTIKETPITFSINFEKEYEKELKNEEKERIEFEKSKIDLKLAKKMLKEFPKTKLFSRIGAFIGIGLAILELIKWIMKLMSTSGKT